MNKNLLYKVLTIGFITLGITETQAEITHFYPLPARLSLWGFEGDDPVGTADGLAPLLGNENQILYADIQSKYGKDDNWFLGGALGYREVYGDSRIFGGYVFVDHTEFNSDTNGHSDFWFLSPGIESLGNLFDFRVNGYIPVSNRSSTVNTAFGDELGIYDCVLFSGHSQYDQLYNVNNNVGFGVDGEVGLIRNPISNRLRIYAGGYHFSPKDSDNINGVAGRIEFAISHYAALTAVDSYDNENHNTALIGLRLTAGGIEDDHSGKEIQRRMVDPISRNLATLSQGNNVPVTTSYVPTGGPVVERSDIYFFDASGGSTFVASQGSNNCTFEHPCAGTEFNQSTVSAIGSFSPQANYYLTPGEYTLMGRLSLPNSESIFGRNQDYCEPLRAATLLGGLSLSGGNHLLDSIILLNDPNFSQGSAINISGVNETTVHNSTIGALNATQGYPIAFMMSNNEVLNIRSSTINAFSNTTSTSLINAVAGDRINFDNSIGNSVFNGGVAGTIQAVGISASNSVFNMTNSTFNISSTNTVGTAASRPIVQSTQPGFYSNSTINSTADGTTGATANGVEVNASTTSTLAGMNLNINATSSGGNAFATGVLAIGANARINVSDSSLDITAARPGEATLLNERAIGINDANFPTFITATNNVFTITAIDGTAYGIRAANLVTQANLVQTGNTFNLTGAVTEEVCMGACP